VEDYRVSLDVYNGPLDLLLYLIQREEVDIYDIPIARITEQFVRYVDALKQLDPNLAGEFLVLAATLLEIKTRMLLPSAPSEDGVAVGVELDPRGELVRQLLQYKAFKDAAGDLRQAALERALRFARQVDKEAAEAERSVDLEEVQVWDLVDAFSKLMESIGRKSGPPEIIYDDTPIELHSADILDLLARQGEMDFERIFEGRSKRSEIIGLFLAILELVRLKKIRATQDRNFGRIAVSLAPATEESHLQSASETAAPDYGGGGASTEAAEPPDSGHRGETAPVPAASQTASQGRYVSETPGDSDKPGDNGNDDRDETEGIGA
jgi:segregation and condensation protein A